MSQQGLRQASIRAITGTSGSYEGDWHALFDLDGIPGVTFNERLLAWISDRLNTEYTNLSDAMAAYAANEGADNFGAIGTITFETNYTYERVTEDGGERITEAGEVRVTEAAA